MVFSSPIFIFLFLPLVLVSYFTLPFRNIILVISSLFFYYWGEGDKIWILLLTSIFSFWCGIRIETSGSKKVSFLWLGVILNLSLLVYFKYFNFFKSIVFQVLQFTNVPMPGFVFSFKEIALPLGISFYVFQNLSYLVDVYRSEVPANRKIIDYLCYITMFPQLVAGPIVRYSDVAGQISRRHISQDMLSYGIYRFIFGLAKKVLVANIVAKDVDTIFSLSANSLDPLVAVTGAIFYTIQIYFDFSGYSDMAIGLGCVFGFKFNENFKSPYRSLSIREFWRKWHISLSSWFRDYVYIPLGGSKVSETKILRNLLAVFILCGLWHGASFTFLCWGMFHGGLLIFERTPVSSILDKLPSLVRRAYTLTMVVIGWVLFRSDSLSQFVDFVSCIFSPTVSFKMNSVLEFLNLETVYALLWLVLLSLPCVKPGSIENPIERLSFASGVISCILFFLSIMELVTSKFNPFLYFRF